MKRQNHMRTVEDFMSTAVISLKESDSISSAELQMKIAEIRHIPVVDERYHVVGIISQRDVFRAAQRGNGGTALPVGIQGSAGIPESP